MRLEPLSEVAHRPRWCAAASEDRSNYQWTYAPKGRAQTGRATWPTPSEKVAAGAQVAFATVRKGGGNAPIAVVGSTRFYEIATGSGPTASPSSAMACPMWWTSGTRGWPRSAQRSPVNTEAKFLMLGHAFEVWQVHRVGLQTDVPQCPVPRKAIERIGGRLDGHPAGRHGRAPTTPVRTSARFSIVAAEWPEVKERLTCAVWQRAANPVEG